MKLEFGHSQLVRSSCQHWSGATMNFKFTPATTRWLCQWVALNLIKHWGLPSQPHKECTKPGKRGRVFISRTFSWYARAVAWMVSTIKHTIFKVNVRYVLSERESEAPRQIKAADEIYWLAFPPLQWDLGDVGEKENGQLVPEIAVVTRWKKNLRKSSLCNIPA